MRKVLSAIACFALIGAVVANAASQTYRGQTFDVSLLSENGEGSTTVENDIYVLPTQPDRRGFVAFHYTVPAAGVTGAVDLTTIELPKGTIFGAGCIMEVQTALLPSSGTAAFACGGAAITAAGNLPEATGIDYLTCDETPAISTSDDIPYATFTATVTQGEFTVYCPIIAGNAQ